MKKLNPKHEAFCREYMIDQNATQAYIRAGYSENGANVSACQLLSNPNIKDRIADLTEEAMRRNRLTVDDIIGVWKDVIDDPECKKSDKLIAARDAGKYLKMFVERHEHDIHGEVTILGLSDFRKPE